MTAAGQLPLFAEITVHCFACPATVTGASPDEAHDLMEQHYATKHPLLIARLAASL